jgi:transcriptional regulator with XRE-family HTH domain
MLARVDDQRFGAGIRTARVKRSWRQEDLASAARVSRGTVSRIERGLIGEMTFETVRRVAAALQVRLEVLPRSAGADFDRVLNARHARLGEAVVRWLASVDGWVVRPEVSFSVYGERGVIDLLAWHAASRTLLVVEFEDRNRGRRRVAGDPRSEDQACPRRRGSVRLAAARHRVRPHRRGVGHKPSPGPGPPVDLPRGPPR